MMLGKNPLRKIFFISTIGLLVSFVVASKADAGLFDGNVFENIARALVKTITTPLEALRNPKSVLKKPSSILDPTQDLRKALGLNKPFKELKQEQEKIIGKGLVWTGRQFKQTLQPIAQELVGVSKKFIALDGKLKVGMAKIGGEITDELLGNGRWKVDLGFATIKSHKSLGDNLTRVVAKHEEVIGKIAAATLQAAPDALNATGELIEELGYFLAVSAETFPHMLDNSVPDIPNPDIQLTMAPGMADRFLQGMNDGPIITRKDGHPGNNYIQLGDLMLTPAPGTNSFMLEAKNSVIGKSVDVVFTNFLKAGVKINKVIFQILPRIETQVEKGVPKSYIRGYVRVLFLDIKDVPPRIDRYLAHVIQEKFLNGRPAFEQNISEYISPKIRVSIKKSAETAIHEKRILKNEMLAATFLVQEQGFSLKILFNLGDAS